MNGREHFAKVPRKVILREMAPDHCIETRMFHAMILWSWCGPEVSDAVVRKDARGWIVRDEAGQPIPAQLKDIGALLKIPPGNKAMLTRTAQALVERKMLGFQGKVMYLEANPPAFEDKKSVDLQINWHFGGVALQSNQLPTEPEARARALQWVENEFATFKEDRNSFNAKWRERVCRGAFDVGILIEEKKKSYEKRENGRAAASIRENTVATALTVRPPAPPPSIRETLKTWLLGRFATIVPTPLDDRILDRIAAHIPDAAALDQFQKAAANIEPRKWGAFLSIAIQCEQHRGKYGAEAPAPLSPKAQAQADRMNRIYKRLKAKRAAE